MSKNRTLPSSVLGLKAAVAFIGERYVTGWVGNEIMAVPLPEPDVIKKFLSGLKAQCDQHNLDYRALANIKAPDKGTTKRVVKISNNPVKRLDIAFPAYTHALARYDFSERTPKSFKDDYAAYQRQAEALQLLRSAISTGVCSATFINSQTGDTKPIHAATANKPDLRFNLSDDTIECYGAAGYLSVQAPELQKAITEHPQSTSSINALRHHTIPPAPQGSTSDVAYLTEKDVSKLLRLSLPTLRRWRVEENTKLPFIKIGRSVRYLKSDVEAHILNNRRRSTSDFRE